MHVASEGAHTQPKEQTTAPPRSNHLPYSRSRVNYTIHNLTKLHKEIQPRDYATRPMYKKCWAMMAIFFFFCFTSQLAPHVWERRSDKEESFAFPVVSSRWLWETCQSSSNLSRRWWICRESLLLGKCLVLLTECDNERLAFPKHCLAIYFCPGVHYIHDHRSSSFVHDLAPVHSNLSCVLEWEVKRNPLRYPVYWYR